MTRLLVIAALVALSGACDGQLRFSDSAMPSSCTRDQDCPLPSLHCDGVSHACVACRTDDDCRHASSPRCDAALHRCVECGSDVDCGAGQICDPTTRRCLIQCAEGEAEHVCPASAPTCDEKRKVCMQCQGDLECSENTDDGDHCDLASGRCVQCTVDADCPAKAPRCDRTRGRCGQCTSASDCGNERACDPDTLTCI